MKVLAPSGATQLAKSLRKMQRQKTCTSEKQAMKVRSQISIALMVVGIVVQEMFNIMSP